MSKPEWMPFYVRRFYSSEDVMMMSHEAVGAYALLLCVAWHAEPPGTLPDDDKALALLCRLPKARWLKVKAQVMKPFVLADGRWHNHVMEGIASKSYAMLDQRREAGKASAAQRALNERCNDRWNGRSTNRVDVVVGSDSSGRENQNTTTSTTTPVERPLNDRSDSRTVRITAKQAELYALLKTKPQWCDRWGWIEPETCRDLACLRTTTPALIADALRKGRTAARSNSKNPPGVVINALRKPDAGVLAMLAEQGDGVPDIQVEPAEDGNP